MNIFPERLQKLMDERGVTQKALETGTGISQATISRYLKGQTEPPRDAYEALADFFTVSMDYLSGRLPEMVLHGHKHAEPSEHGGPYWGTSDEAPVVQPVAAGEAHAWEDRGHDAPRVKVNCKDPNCYAVEVWGDSMMPTYLPGDILVISPNTQPMVNDLVVFKTVEEEPYFKKYLGIIEKKKERILRFASFNPNYPVMEFRPEEMRKMHPVHSVIRPLKGKIF